MDNRKQQVLTAIVRLYSTDGEPVASTVLAKHLRMSVSSATLRNEMSALTKLGLLLQPHTSAGRIPSPEGYRYYIDNLLENNTQLKKSEKQQINNLFAEMDLNPEHLTAHSAKAISQICDFAALVLTPENANTCAAHFNAVQVGLYTVAVLCVTDVGGVSTRTAKLQTPLQNGDIEILNKILNKYLVFTNPADITISILQNAIYEMGERASALLPCIDAAQKLLSAAGKAKLYCTGHDKLLKYNNYHFDTTETSLRNLMAFMADEKAIRHYLTQNSASTNILLGEDITAYPMPGYCIISKQYIAGGGRKGTIAIIGPARMQYKENIQKLEYFAGILSEYISNKT